MPKLRSVELGHFLHDIHNAYPIYLYRQFFYSGLTDGLWIPFMLKKNQFAVTLAAFLLLMMFLNIFANSCYTDFLQNSVLLKVCIKLQHISLQVSCIKMIFLYYSKGVYQCRDRRFSLCFCLYSYKICEGQTKYSQTFSGSCLHGYAKSSGATTNANVQFVNGHEEITSVKREEVLNYKICLPFSS